MGNPRITILHQAQPGKTFELDKPVVTIGRKQGCNICIPDATVSSHHCDFVRNDDGEYTLKDNSSTNGTFVNNARIKEQTLQNSDLVRLGDVILIYNSADSPATVPVPVASRTHTINLDTIGTTMMVDREMTNFNPFANAEQRRQAKTQLVMVVLLGLVVLMLLGFLIAFMTNAFSTGK